MARPRRSPGRHLAPAVTLAILCVLAQIGAAGPAVACSPPGTDFDRLSLADLRDPAALDHSTPDSTDHAGTEPMVVVIRSEVVARSGNYVGFHRGGVIAAVAVWGEGDAPVATDPAIFDHGRNRGGDCYFGVDIGPLGDAVTTARIDDRVYEVEGGVSADELDDLFGPPRTVEPDPVAVDELMAQVMAIRPWWRHATLLGSAAGAAVIMTATVFVAGLRRRSTKAS